MQLEQATMAQSKTTGHSGDYTPAMFRGRIERVLHADETAAKQTLVDLYMYDLMPALYSVPVMASKMGAKNGEHSTPEVGDIVAVALLGGRMRDPVVIGYLPVHNNSVQAKASDAPHYKREQSGTTETVDKDGNRIIHVAKDDTLTITGDGTVNVTEGNLNIHVGDENNANGNITITVTGNADINATNATVSATEMARVEAAAVEVESGGTVSVTGTGAITVESTGGTCTVSSTGAMNITGSGNINMSATGTINLSAADVNITTI